jgi:hypothetical protein
MIRRSYQLRWIAGVAAGAVAAIVTYYATLTAQHDRAAEQAAKGGSPDLSSGEYDVGEWKVEWIQ